MWKCKLLIFLTIIMSNNKCNELNPIEETVDLELDGNDRIGGMKIGYKVNHLDSPLVDIVWCGK